MAIPKMPLANVSWRLSIHKRKYRDQLYLIFAAVLAVEG
jgi:hypothetical protein